MSDLIRREDALSKFEKACTFDSVDKNGMKRGEIKTALTLEGIRKILETIPSAEPEPETFEWCHDCKEYDQEKHCCHRWTKVIRQTVEELKAQEPERKKGKWEVQPSTGDDRPFIWWKCSECGHVIFSETERDRKEFHAFCGRCGAEMTR